MRIVGRGGGREGVDDAGFAVAFDFLDVAAPGVVAALNLAAVKLGQFFGGAFNEDILLADFHAGAVVIEPLQRGAKRDGVEVFLVGLDDEDDIGERPRVGDQHFLAAPVLAGRGVHVVELVAAAGNLEPDCAVGFDPFEARLVEQGDNFMVGKFQRGVNALQPDGEFLQGRGVALAGDDGFGFKRWLHGVLRW